MEDTEKEYFCSIKEVLARIKMNAQTEIKELSEIKLAGNNKKCSSFLK